MQLRNYREEFIFPLKHHIQRTEAGVQEIETCSATEISEEDASKIVSICSIKIAPINRDISKQVEVINRKGDIHMKSGVDDNRQILSCKSKRRETSGAEKYPSRVHPKTDIGKILIACNSNNIPTVRNMERVKEVIRLKKEGKTKTAKVTR